MSKKPCAHCGGLNLDDGLVGLRSSVEIMSQNARLVGMTKAKEPLHRAEVCLDCGYVALFVHAPAYRRSLKVAKSNGAIPP